MLFQLAISSLGLFFMFFDRAKLREKQFQLNSAKSSHDKEKSALEQSPNFRPGEVIATLTKKLHGIED